MAVLQNLINELHEDIRNTGFDNANTLFKIKGLIACRRGINEIDKNGNTPLDLAVLYGNVPICKMLMEIRDEITEELPLNLAIKMHDRADEIIDLFVNKNRESRMILRDSDKMRTELISMSAENKVKLFPVVVVEMVDNDVLCGIFDNMIRGFSVENLRMVYNRVKAFTF